MTLQTANSLSMVLPLEVVFISAFLTAVSISSFAAGYTVQEIPIPTQIKIPAGLTGRPVCSSINELGQVACNLEIIETLFPTPKDRFSKTPKLFASYAYSWDSRTNALMLLSSDSPSTVDKAYVINDNGLIAGSTAQGRAASQGAIWYGNPGPTLHGTGVITDLNNAGDFVMNNQLVINDRIANFAGKRSVVHVINSLGKAAGTQVLSAARGASGIGLLYSTAPSTTKAKPWFALSGITSGVTVKDLTDNGKFVISGIPNTASGLVALNCKELTLCQIYSPTVGASGRITPWISLNSVNKVGEAVGTDTGIAILIAPPSAAVPAGNRVNLNLSLQPGDLNTGWFLNVATDNNNAGQIVGAGLKGSKKIAFLLTPLI